MLRKVSKFTVYSLQFTKKNLFLCLLSASFLILSFPNFNLWVFSWFGFVPLFFAMENKKPFQRFFLSYFTGVIFFIGTLYWLYHVSILGLILLVLYLAIYFGLFGLITSFYSLLATHYSLLALPSLWVLLEYLRSHLFTGFGWILLGYSQYLNLPIIQIADITGVWGVSFLIMMANVMIWQLLSEVRLQPTCHAPFFVRGIQKSEVRKVLFCFLFSVFCFLFVMGYGYYKLNLPPTSYLLPTKIKVSVIQGNIPQEIKWEEASSDFILDRYFDLTRKAREDSPDLIIWPEAAYPETISSKEELGNLVNLVKEIKTPILLGAIIRDRDLYFNSAILIKSEREILHYDKLHLVPFGEYIPLKKIFGFLETIYPIGDFTPGKEYKVFTLTPNYSLLPTNFSVLICFEDIFPQISRGFVKRGADFLVNITNDAWFGRTSAPYQHLQASVFRAIENRRYLTRAANTGISCFITPKGEILSKVSHEKKDIFICGYKTEDIFLNFQTLTLYTRFGDYFVFLCLVICSYGIIQMKPQLMERKRT